MRMLHFCNGGRMVSHMSTDWWDYVQDVIGDDSYTDAANRAGFDKSAFSRWRKGAKADPAFAVALARGYGANVLEALVAAGLITSREAGLTVVHSGADDAIRQASGRMLADELARRLSSAEAVACAVGVPPEWEVAAQDVPGEADEEDAALADAGA